MFPQHPPQPSAPFATPYLQSATYSPPKPFAYQMTSSTPINPPPHLVNPEPVQTSAQYLPPEFQELQHIVSSQTNRLGMLQDQLSSQQLSHAIEIQRIQSQHVMEMEQLRKLHSEQLNRFRLSRASGTSSTNPAGSEFTGVPGQRKAWDASNLPLDEYLKYLDKFQQDAAVLSTLAKADRELPTNENSDDQNLLPLPSTS